MSDFPTIAFSDTAAHAALKGLAASKQWDMRQRFTAESDRFEKFSISSSELLFDYSKNLVDDEVMTQLIASAEQCKLSSAIEAMFTGQHINQTEDRAVMHTALRAKSPSFVDGRDVTPDVQAVLTSMKSYTERVLSGEHLGATGKKLTTVVNIGIGGSDLGPVMVTEALKSFQVGLKPYFVSNVDGADLTYVLADVDPETTLFIVVSKTFTTQETLTNAHAARTWLVEKLGEEAVASHFAAVSTNLDGVKDFGILEANTFGFWSWVGGRYSLWGAVGLSIALSCGWNNFQALLDGANAADEHFRRTSFEKNVPVIMALLGIWYRNYLNFGSYAIIPYSQDLHRFPAYLQQADMESNGKYVDRNGQAVDFETGPVIWGEPGTNGQHAFFQLLHQGTEKIPVDFIAFAKATSPYQDHHDKLLANCLAQSEAMMNGKTEDEVVKEMQAAGVSEASIDQLKAYRTFEGNRPSTTILYKELTPFNIGHMIALYEHKIFVQGVMWNVFSFDQWGVELGKALAKRILPVVKKEKSGDFDASTSALIEKIHQFIDE
ncbi:glucose-6-phosphate isomerase [Sanyastnella coralliicola]|uniref:glucose-6-phosphate isomerase n=1 Tax=Sanyastnella coralliicola TaxID=3069118 RepID=UPI0027B8B49A|nr:glucose-6-phosphate isomerase [Longitalea sp. SCSIO 12813]